MMAPLRRTVQMTQILRNTDLRRFFQLYFFYFIFLNLRKYVRFDVSIAEGICVICVPIYLGTARYRIMPMKVNTILGNQTAKSGGIPPDWAIPLLIMKKRMYRNANIKPRAI